MSSSALFPTPRRQIVIVGGGIIGSATAFYLARHPSYDSSTTSITLVEGTSIAAGASGKAGGLLALDWHGASTSSLAALSYKLHRDLAEEFEGAKRWGYRALDTLSVQATVGTSGGKARKATKRLDVFDWLNPDVLTGHSKLGDRNTTSQAHPELLTKALAEEAGKRGVKIVYGTVTGLSGSQPYQLAYTPLEPSANSTTLPATDLIIAAGPWTGKLCGDLGIAAGRAGRITGSRAHSVVIRPEPGKELPAQALFTSIKEANQAAEPEIYASVVQALSSVACLILTSLLSYAQNRPDGTAYACGPTDDSDLPPLASDVKVSPTAIKAILHQVAALSPSHLRVESEGGAATVVKEQACYLPVGSGDPVIGRLQPGIWVASGHSCWGIMNGPGTGQVVAELVFEGKAKSANIDQLKP